MASPHPLAIRPPIPLKIVGVLADGQHCIAKDMQDHDGFIIHNSLLPDLIAIGHKLQFDAGLPLHFIMNAMPKYGHKLGSGIKVYRVYQCTHNDCVKVFGSQQELHTHYQQVHK